MQPVCEILPVNEYNEETMHHIRRLLPGGDYRRVVLKPNWVKHESDQRFPISTLVTDTSLVEAVLSACLDKYPNLREVAIADAPLQGCDWDLLVRQAQIDKLIERYGRFRQPRISIVDLREEAVMVDNGYLGKKKSRPGDPEGYRDIVLDSSSFLDEISHQGRTFRVSDYNPKETISNHVKGSHRYRVAGTVVKSELFINLPKMKSHQKAGVTGCLKNLVGVNGNKAYLVHYRHGMSILKGDEFPRGVPLPVVAQVRVRAMMMNAPQPVFRFFQLIWRAFRKLYGIQVESTVQNLGRKFFIAGGSWFGNNTIWRMVYDLNKIIRYSDQSGVLNFSSAQRDYVAFVDGLTAGEGNGPLEPLPVTLGVLVCGYDPFAIDMVMAKLMGFDYRSIPCISNHALFNDPQWGAFDPSRLRVKEVDGMVNGIHNVRTRKLFLPPPGWRGHIELSPNCQ